MRFILAFYRLYFKLIAVVSTKAAAQAAIGLFSTPVRKKARSMEAEILKKAQKRKFRFGQSNLAVYQWGQGKKKALLVHGWEGNAGSMGAMVQPLVDDGFEVTALDGPAHGSSDGKQTNFFIFSDAVMALCNEIKNPDLIITHSFGSAVTLYGLTQQPSVTIDKMVMLTTPDQLKIPFQEFAQLMKLSGKVLDEMYNIVEKKYGVKVDEISGSRLCHKASINKLLIIHDKADKIIPFEFSKRIAEKFPGAKLVPFNQIGHYRMLWNNDVIKTIREFIN